LVDLNELTNLNEAELQQKLESMSDEELNAIELQLGGTPISSGEDKGYPTPPDKDSIFKFFREIIRAKDSSKIANVQIRELGFLPLSIRGYQSIALFAKNQTLDDVADYLGAEAEIVLATSLSKKGFLPQLFVTQIKREKKDAPKDLLKVEKKGFLGLGSSQTTETGEE